MIDDKQSSIVRPKAVPPMYTQILTPNTQSTPNTMAMNNNNNNIVNTPPNRTPQQAMIEMGLMIRKHDPEATRLYDCIGQVKVFAYNSTELRWENTANIEGTLCAYEKQQMIHNKISPAYAFAILSGEKSLIQPVTSDMAQHADKLRLFYEVARHGRREVFCLHFQTEAECLRLHTFLNRCIQVLRTLVEQQARTIIPPPPPPSSVPVSMDSQSPQINGQAITPTMPVQQTPTMIYRQPMMVPNPTTPQFASSRVNINQTPTRLNTGPILPPPLTPQQQQQHHQINAYPVPPQIPIDLTNINLTRMTPTIPSHQIEIPKPLEQTPFPPSPIPTTNGNNTTNNNNNTEDPTLSLKRLLNIRGQSGLENRLENVSLDDNQVFPKHQTTSQQQQQQQQQQQPQNLLDLMPPSAFEPIAATPPSPVVAIGAERVKHRLSHQFPPPMTRDHFRNVLLHLVQTDDHFLDIIYQACLTYPPPSSQ